MTKIDKIRLLLKLTNSAAVTHDEFHKKIMGLDLERPDADQLKAEILYNFDQRFDEYVEEQVKVYDARLTERAIDDSIEFYTSISGDEICAKMPGINEQLGQLDVKLSYESLTDLKSILERD